MAAELPLGSMRMSYQLGRLDEHDLPATWLELFAAWFADALADPSVVEANAIALATADGAGYPSVRTVLAKDVDADGLVFYTNYDSAKGRELAANPVASAVFTWLALQRQVRFSGPTTPVPREQTQAYFASRPRGSRIGAWSSPQSQVIADRSALDVAAAAVELRFAGVEDIPAPPHWGGYRLRPVAVEFWQGRQDRLHDRIRYRPDGTGAAGTWIRERLAP